MPSEIETRPRLNPFAFPADTTPRFILLLVFVTGADVLYWHGIASQLGGTISELDRCRQSRPLLGPEVLDPVQRGAITQCMQFLAAHELSWLGLGLALLIVATLALYWTHPVWVRWWLGLINLPEKELPDVVGVLPELCALAGLRRCPSFLWNPLDGSPQARAYGYRSSYRVGLTGGLAARFYTQPDSFRGILLHELAHIRNRDIPKTYLTVAVWWGFVATALVPYVAIQLVLQHQWWNVLDMFLRVAIFAGVVFLSRNAVLRARELYADIRASSWEPRPGGLAAAIDALRPGARLLGWLSVHPDPALRRLLLNDTDALFRARFWDAFSIGAAAAIAAISLVFLLLVVGLGSNRSLVEAGVWAFSLSLAVVPLSAAAAGAMVWRGTFLAAIRGQRLRVTGRIALGLATGAASGFLFFGYPFIVAAAGGPNKQYLSGQSLPISVLLVIGVAVVTVAVIVLTAVFALYLSWVAAGARSWLPTALRLWTPRAVWVVGLAVTGALAIASFSFVPLVIAGYFISKGLEGKAATAVAGLVTATRVFPFNLIAWASMIGVWAYPMAAAVWRPGSRPRGGEWAFLDPAPPVDAASPLRPRRALLIGLAGGLIGGVALWQITIDRPHQMLQQFYLPETTWLQQFYFPETTLAARLLSLVLIAITTQLATGTAAAIFARRLGFVHAMFAAFVAGWVLTVAECICVLSWGVNASVNVFFDLVIVPTLVGGAIATLPAAIAVAAVADRRP